MSGNPNILTTLLPNLRVQEDVDTGQNASGRVRTLSQVESELFPPGGANKAKQGEGAAASAKILQPTTPKKYLKKKKSRSQRRESSDGKPGQLRENGLPAGKGKAPLQGSKKATEGRCKNCASLVATPKETPENDRASSVADDVDGNSRSKGDMAFEKSNIETDNGSNRSEGGDKKSEGGGDLSENSINAANDLEEPRDLGKSLESAVVDASEGSKPTCRLCAEGPNAASRPLKGGIGEQVSLRPRDSPSRYNFRTLKRSPPLISEQADGQGYLRPSDSHPKLQDLTVVPYACSPPQPGVKMSLKDEAASPLVSGNLVFFNNYTSELKDVVVTAAELSNPSSCSTLSSTDLDLVRSGAKIDPASEDTKPAAAARTLWDIKSEDEHFAPVDVTKSGGYVFCTSQATNRVEVFGSDGSKGLLKLRDKKMFQSPRNILHIPPCPSDQDQPAGKSIIKAGCIVVLDNVGFHVFAENGHFAGTLLEGEGRKYRGLSYVRRKDKLSLVTVDVDGEDAVYIAIIDLKENAKPPEKILVAELPDTMLKCRFIAMAPGFPTDEADPVRIAYVTSLATGDVFRVDVETKESTKMKFFTTSKEDLAEGTFVDNNNDACSEECGEKKVPVKLVATTGIAIDKHGNVIIADRAMSVMECFAPNGLHVKSLKRCQERNVELSEPIGIHYDRKEERLYAASNKNKTVLVFDLGSCG